MNLFLFSLLSLVLSCMNISIEAAKKRGLESRDGVSKLDAEGRLHAPDGKFKRRAKASEIEAALAEGDHTELVAAVAHEVLVPIAAARSAEHQQRLVAAACSNNLLYLEELLASPLTTLDMVQYAHAELRKLSSGVLAWRRHIYTKLFDAEKRLSPVVAPAMLPVPVLAPAPSSNRSGEDRDDNDEKTTPEVAPTSTLSLVPHSAPATVAPGHAEEHLQKLITVAQTGDVAELKMLLASDKTTIDIVNQVRAAVKGISRHILSNKLAVLTVLNEWKYQKLNDCHEKATDAVEPDGGTCFIS